MPASQARCLRAAGGEDVGTRLDPLSLGAALLALLAEVACQLNDAQFVDHANLTFTNLSHATLRNADLTHVDLRCANLSGADLTGADLDSADLRGANLTGTILTNIKSATAAQVHQQATVAPWSSSDKSNMDPALEQAACHTTH